MELSINEQALLKKLNDFENDEESSGMCPVTESEWQNGYHLSIIRAVECGVSDMAITGLGQRLMEVFDIK